MQYFVTPHYNIAVNAKVATNAIAAGIVLAHYPQRLEHAGEVHDLTCRALVEQTGTPDKPVLMLFRDPVDRFASACAMLRLDVDAALAELQTGGELCNDVHFTPQSGFSESATIYKYPEHLVEFCAVAGLSYPLPMLNESYNEKPELTAAQKKAAAAYYAADIALFEALPSRDCNSG